jgi:polysaccharide biosynthesis protein PslG
MTPLPGASGSAPARAVTSNAEHFALSPGGHVHNFGSAELARELDGYRAVGARWIRVEINWHVIQAAGPQSFNWPPFDDVVRGARERGINVLGVINYTPPWARDGAGDPAHPPARPADYAAFAAQAVRRYAPMGVRHWEIWNEPNIPEFWKTGPNAAAYTELLRAAYPAIKQVDPGSTVISGGLSPYGAYGAVSADGRINPLTFLERMYAAGAKGNFDALGYHPYNFPGLAFHPASGWSQMVDTSPSVRSIMTANGDAAKQVWATEFGAPTRGGAEAITEEQLARLVTDSYRAFGSYSWAGPLFWYAFRDLGTSGTNREHFFGLVRNDFSPKAAFAAFQQAAVEARR